MRRRDPAQKWGSTLAYSLRTFCVECSFHTFAFTECRQNTDSRNDWLAIYVRGGKSVGEKKAGRHRQLAGGVFVPNHYACRIWKCTPPASLTKGADGARARCKQQCCLLLAGVFWRVLPPTAS